jgi:hypothetical protein
MPSRPQRSSSTSGLSSRTAHSVAQQRAHLRVRCRRPSACRAADPGLARIHVAARHLRATTASSVWVPITKPLGAAASPRDRARTVAPIAVRRNLVPPIRRTISIGGASQRGHRQKGPVSRSFRVSPWGRSRQLRARAKPFAYPEVCRLSIAPPRLIEPGAGTSEGSW